MSTDKWAALKKLAQEAADGNGFWLDEIPLPATVLELIEENEQLRRELQNQQSESAQIRRAYLHEKWNAEQLRRERDELNGRKGNG